eukprot:5518223-Prymnesium_polylepis.1
MYMRSAAEKLTPPGPGAPPVAPPARSILAELDLQNLLFGPHLPGRRQRSCGSSRMGRGATPEARPRRRAQCVCGARTRCANGWRGQYAARRSQRGLHARAARARLDSVRSRGGVSRACCARMQSVSAFKPAPCRL